MSKNMIRKSLAFGAISSLAVTGLVGVMPASAAISAIDLAPISGTSTVGVQGYKFIFTANPKGNSAETLTVVLEGIEKADITSLVHKTSSSLTSAGAFDFSSSTDLLAIAVDNASTGNAHAPFTAKAGEYSVFALDIKDAEFTAAETVTIRVIEEASTVKDGVHDPALDGAQSSAFDITFLEPADVVASVTAVAPALGDTAAEAYFKFENGINNRSINAASFGTVGFELDGAAAVVDAAITASDYTSSRDGFKAAATVGTANANSVLFAKAYVLARTTAAGTGNSATGAAGTIATLTSLEAANGQAGKTSGDVIRVGSGTVNISTVAKKSGGAVVEGEVVTFKITEGSALKGTVTAGGSSLTNASSTNAAENIVVQVTTDSSGKASFDLGWTGLKAGDNVVVSATAQGVSAVIIGASKTLTAAASSVEAVQATVGDIVSVVKGASVTVPGKLVDQFGVTPDGTLRVKYTVAGGSMLSTIVQFANVAADGSFSMNWTDNSTAAGVPVLTINDVEKSVNGSFTTQSTAGLDTVSVNVTAAASSISRMTFVKSAAATHKDDLSTSSLISYNGLSVNQTQPNALTDGDTLTATVFNADGSAAQGVAVTFSGTNVQFEGTTQGIREYGVGSWTGYTNASGVVVAEYTSNISGSAVVSVSAGSLSASETVAFAAPGVKAGVKWVISAPSFVLPGAQLVYSATLADKYGNAVATTGSDVAVTQSGAGLSVGSLPTDTDSNGQIRLAILVGSNESGTGTIKVKSAQTAGDVENTFVFTIGAAPAVAGDYGTVSAWTKNMGDGTAKVYVKFPTVGDKVRIGHQTGGSGSYETIYVKTTSSETMSGLTVVEGVGTYIVRTIDLADISRIRITVGDDVLAQVRYNK